MKYLLIVISCLILLSISCKKNNDCTIVTITNSAPACGIWGIVVNGTKYPSGNIPLEFQEDGRPVCTEYELYEDMRVCACCGGTWAKIISMRNLPH